MSFSVEEYLKSPFLHGTDLEEGESKVVTVKNAEPVTFPQSGDTVLVLEFEELDQKLSCNKTRLRKMAELFGTDYRQYVGQKISLYPVPVSFNGKPTLSVAILAPPKKEKTTTATPKPETNFTDDDGEVNFSSEPQTPS